MTEVNGIVVDYSRDALFDELGLKRLIESYMTEDEKSPQERYAKVSKQFSSNPEHAQRLYEYASKHWLSYATPILSFGKSKGGLPISCFLNYMDDSASGLVNTLSETNWLSMMGGGVGIHLGIRSADSKSTGIMPHLKIYDAGCLAYRQGLTRRGSYAAYLDISHPDIIQFLEMRKPTGDPNLRCMNLHHGINISDEFMNIIEKAMLDPDFDDAWPLLDPHSGIVKEVVSAKELWQRILEMRMQTGEPYIVFLDTANHKLPEWLKKEGLKINGSNLCSEIYLGTSKDRTAVCCLSSLNLEYFEDWSKDKLFLKDVAEMLDNVLTYFIENAPTEIGRATYSAMRERSIGVGALGLHAYFQKKNIAFESVGAKSANLKMFKHIRAGLDEANLALGAERGPCPDAEKHGYKVRFSHLMAIAPNACQSKDNKIQTSELGAITLNDFLHVGGVSVAEIEDSKEKQWVEMQHPVKVPTLKGEKTVSRVWYNGLEEVYELEFQDGQKYKFTGNHRLLTVMGGDEEGWAFVKDFLAGRTIRCSEGSSKAMLEIKNIKRLDPEHTWDLSVPEAEHYFMENGVVSHNSTSIVLGNTSPSIEPYRANVFRQDTLSGASVYKNRFLVPILEARCKEFKQDVDEVWMSIIANDGSVQHLDILDEHTKAVFKTAMEIDQRWVIDLAGDRQKYIDQGQSVNLFFKPDSNIKYFHAVHFLAWKVGLKGLYYCRSDKYRKADKVSQKIERQRIEEEIDLQEIIDGNACIACEG